MPKRMGTPSRSWNFCQDLHLLDGKINAWSPLFNNFSSVLIILQKEALKIFAHPSNLACFRANKKYIRYHHRLSKLQMFSSGFWGWVQKMSSFWSTCMKFIMDAFRENLSRAVGTRGSGGWSPSPLHSVWEFSQPYSSQGWADYVYHITACPPDLKTLLQLCIS